MDIFLEVYWPYLVALIGLGMSLAASVHAMLTKRDVRSAIAWVSVSWLSPYLGPIIYLLFGINRIKRRAVRLKRRRADGPTAPILAESDAPTGPASTIAEHLAPLRRLVDTVARRPLTRGNRIEPLIGGDAVFDAMVAAVEEARVSVALSTYIFDHDPVGLRMADALARAVERGVAVRVLIDALGARYSRPQIPAHLRARGVTTALFLQSLLPWRLAYANLRNHRKILVVDGRTGFTGGANLRADYSQRHGTGPIKRDVHFRCAGPVVAHLMEAFAEDWAFTTGEILDDDLWFPHLEPLADGLLARGIPSGPDRNFEATHLTLLGALAQARERVTIATPYFLPDRQLVGALGVAAARGVTVDIILPEENNLRLVAWAATAQLPQVIRPGCRVHLAPPPFDHSKLTIVDGAWMLIGSSNWDPRSLRLNFELDVEIYDRALAAVMEEALARVRRQSRRVTLEDLAARPLPVRLRDAAAWLLTPYL